VHSREQLYSKTARKDSSLIVGKSKNFTSELRFARSEHAEQGGQTAGTREKDELNGKPE
jgi:hypothetical protein